MLGQLTRHTRVSTLVGGAVGVGCMTGISGWQAVAAAVGPGNAMWIVGAASLAIVLGQACLAVLFEGR